MMNRSIAGRALLRVIVCCLATCSLGIRLQRIEGDSRARIETRIAHNILNSVGEMHNLSSRVGRLRGGGTAKVQERERSGTARNSKGEEREQHQDRREEVAVSSNSCELLGPGTWVAALHAGDPSFETLQVSMQGLHTAK
jgi:hypothetical protein